MDKQERFNVLTSLPGLLAAPIGLVVLVALAARQGDPWKIVSFSVYGTTLLLLYLFTTLYHAMRGKAKEVFQKLDHYAIYFLIAGTYTPFSLVTLRGGWGWTMFGLVWGGAILGIGYEMLSRNGSRIIPVAIYLAMGWTVLIAIKPLLHAMPLAGVIWLALGGLFYTGGVAFYALDGRFVKAHGFWHLCVLAGSISHYLAVLCYIA
jgi:hemolysin III